MVIGAASQISDSSPHSESEGTLELQVKMVQLNGGFDDCDYAPDAAIESTPSREMSDVPQFHSIDDAKGSMPGQSITEDDIAVIGIALKFPGDAASTEAFWKMLVDRQSALSDIQYRRFLEP